MRARFSSQALDELDDVLAYIAQQNPQGAGRVLERVMRATARIERHPYSAREIRQRPGVHKLPIGRYPYSIYYEIIAGEIVILRILHDARAEPFGD